MDWAIYGALIAAFLAVAGATAFLAVNALRGWRDFKRLRRSIGREFERLADSADRTADNAARATDTIELTTALARLGVSLARVAVLRAAVDEVDDTVRRVAVFYPRK
jgi:hypothetical protein